MAWTTPVQVVIAMLGLAIAGTALQAYWRNGESIMLFVAAGFVLVSTHGVVEYVAEDVLLYGPATGELIEVTFIGLGMVCFFFALFGPVEIDKWGRGRQ